MVIRSAAPRREGRNSLKRAVERTELAGVARRSRQGTSAPKRPAFVAIDFEIADYGRDSACAVGLVRVEGGKITKRATHLLRPPRREFAFTYIHGLTWRDVKDAPSFPELWPELEPLFEGASFLVAHNAGFDRSVLRACLREAGLPEPVQPFKCSVRLAKSLWGLRSAALPDVCSHLGIKLKHHDAGSDAEACARIVMAAGSAVEELPSLKPPR